MADSRGHHPNDSHDSHHHDAPEEDVVRTPLWLTFVGLGLLLAGSLGTYLFVYPGTMAARDDAETTADSGDGGAATGDAAAVPQAVEVH